MVTSNTRYVVTIERVKPMTEQQKQNTPTPEDRAEAAARDLVDRGLPVTARAVRENAGVRMAVAAQTARAWKEATAEQSDVVVPDVPEDVTSRLTAIWADAYRAAYAKVRPERDTLATAVKKLEAEVEALTEAVGAVEDERDAFASEAKTAQATASEAIARAEAAEQATREAKRAAREAESRIASIEEERDRLDKQVTALIERIPRATKTAEAQGQKSKNA
jgi:predicted  nucleic acid-binding Zn-ribbon protein